MKHFYLNLDVSPEERYKEVISSFDLKSLKPQFEGMFRKYLLESVPFPFLERMIQGVVYFIKNKVMYHQEIEFWSKILDVPFHQVLMMQLVYEINSGCTTIVKDGVMYRTFDWPELFLKDIVYQATFIKDEKEIYQGVCFLGSVGLFTGKSLTRDYSLAINYRRCNNFSFGGVLKNIKNLLMFRWPVSYLLRYILEKESVYEESVLTLKEAKLVSPVYFTLNQYHQIPVIIQRGVDDYQIFKMNERWIVQTNCDTDTLTPDIEYSVDRLRMVKKILLTLKDEKDFQEKILKFPVVREDTIYFSILGKDKFESKIVG